MKLNLFNSFLLILYVSCCFSQNSSVMVEYKIRSQSSSVQKDYENESANKTVDEVLSGVERNIDLVEFILYCNEYSSIYYLKNKLQVKDDFTYKIASKLGGSGIYYKDNSSKIKIVQKDALGEKLNVIYDFNQDEWEILHETKTINGYVCYKAISKREEYNYLKKTNNIVIIEVWFTPKIPVPFGPKGFDGLPGLVLEATSNGKTFICASKIIFGPTDIATILKKPKGGRDISYNDYLKVLSERIND